MTKLDKFCKYTPLKVLGISIAISIIVTILYSLLFMTSLSEGQLRNRHGEGDISNFIIAGGCFFYSVVCSVCSYSIYFNLYKTVRDNIALCFLSFYFPIIFIPLVSGLFWGATNGLLASLGMIFFSIPFLIVQTYYFIRFRIRLSSGEILEDFYYEVEE